MRRTLENLKNKPESYRNKIAVFTATGITAAIFVSWATYNGFIDVPKPNVAIFNSADNVEVTQTASVANSASTPLHNSKVALRAAFGKFKREYGSLRESLSNVLAPFMSGIEVYESK